MLEFSGLDIITDRNNLRKLLSFITGSNRDAFEMQLQRLGSITLFQRCEPASTEFVEEFRGYGCEFEKMFTRPGVRGSRAHHRVVAYEFGGLQMMVRFEVDAIVAPDAVDTLDVGEEDYTASSQTLRVHKTGGLPYGTMDAEIKTRATHRRLVLKDVMPQLWFSQTERLLVGYHRDGVFGEVWENDVEATGEMEKWEQRHRKDLRRLVALLRIIVDAVEKVGGRAELVSSGRKNLKVRKVEGSDLVPADVKAALEK